MESRKTFDPSSLEQRADGRSVVGRTLAEIVFGPVHSRRYGRALGINLLPSRRKICNLNCPYCECGFTDVKASRSPDPDWFPTREAVRDALEKALTELAEAGEPPDAIMEAGNGEPTLHPAFAEVSGDIRALRDRLAPGAKLGILSSGGTLDRPEIREALRLYDEVALKLDAGTETLFRRIAIPVGAETLEDQVRRLKSFPGPFTVQTLFVQGRLNNAADEEVDAWLERLKEIRPRRVTIYSIDRRPADARLERVPAERLAEIAERVRAEAGLPCEVF